MFQPVTVLPSVAEVRFTGNDVLPTAALLRPISDVAVGIPYTEPALRERLDTAIRPLYEARGRDSRGLFRRSWWSRRRS